jgi:hypothetical protein
MARTNSAAASPISFGPRRRGARRVRSRTGGAWAPRLSAVLPIASPSACLAQHHRRRHRAASISCDDCLNGPLSRRFRLGPIQCRRRARPVAKRLGRTRLSYEFGFCRKSSMRNRARLQRVRQSPACSKACAAWISVASSKWRPTSIMPTGRPLTLPQGMVKAGCPLTSKGQVFCCMLRARST